MNRVIVIPVVLLLVLGVGCYFLSAGPMREVGGGKSRPIVVCYPDDVKTLDVGEMSWMNDIRTAMALWEGLTTYGSPDNGKDLTPLPGAAESWDISPDGKTYTFHLRKEGRWSNGDPVTADDFIFAWKRVFVPSTGANYLTLFDNIEGGTEYATAMGAWKPGMPMPDFSSVGVRSPDPYTLVVRLKYPRAYFLDLCAFPTFFPLHEKSMRKFLNDPSDPMKGYDERWSRPPELVTNGPFRLAEWKFKQYILLKANEHYWDRANVKCDELVIKSISDQRAQFLAYQSGTCDVVTAVPAEFGEYLLQQRDAGRKDIHYYPVFGTYYFVYNCNVPPLDDARVRKALTLAVDRQKIVNDVTRMGQKPLGLLVPPDSIPGYHSPGQVEMDVPQAQKLLADAGYPDGKGFRSLELMYNTESIHERVAQAIGQMWEQNLHIQVTYRGLERGSFGSERQVTHHFDVARAGWYGDYRDPTTWLNLAKTGDQNNDGLYSNPAYDKLLDAAVAETNPQKRLDLLSAAEAIIVHDDFPFLPLYQYADGYMFDPDKIGGINANVRLLTNLKWIYRK